MPSLIGLRVSSWRLQSEAGNATDIQTTSDSLFLVNMSLWSDAEALFDFVYRSAHTPEMARRREYFERFEGAYQALWWVPAGHTPDVDEGLSRLWTTRSLWTDMRCVYLQGAFPGSRPFRPAKGHEARSLVSGPGVRPLASFH